jgi:hypothetical protein
MKLLGTIQHLPSTRNYLVGRLTSSIDKNTAYALLYRKYIEEARHPWKIPLDNASGLRVEERFIEGSLRKVIVDDLEDRSIVGGIKCSVTGDLLGTARILYRPYQYDGLLEMERYRSFPDNLRKAIAGCDVEGNRMAVDGDLRKKRCILLLYAALMKDVGGKSLVYTTPPKLVEKVPLADKFVLGSFRYHPCDEYAASVGMNSSWTVPMIAQLYAASAGSLYIPARHSGGTKQEEIEVPV